tara:strand:- start:1111 stop:2028 length:918 start_codon:yes stop_codon:yes gene_type:complete
MSKIAALDIETDALDATRIHCVVAQDVASGETEVFLNIDRLEEERLRFEVYCSTVDKFVMHNGIGFDAPVINRLLGSRIVDTNKIIDTLIVSRLVNYSVAGGHSLSAWGVRLGFPKLDFKEFEVLTQEMIDYCIQDVVVTVKLYENFKDKIHDPAWASAMRCEHDIQILCETMTGNGFKFDAAMADHLLDEIELSMAVLEDGFQEDFPPQLVEVNRIMYRINKDGRPASTVLKAREKYFRTNLDTYKNPPELVCYDFVAFNPASPKMRIDRLWEAEWTPYEKTKGHIDYEREKRFANKSSWRKVR